MFLKNSENINYGRTNINFNEINNQKIFIIYVVEELLMNKSNYLIIQKY